MQTLSRRPWHMLLVVALAGCSRDEAPTPALASALRSVHVPVAVQRDESAAILPDWMALVVDPAAGVLLAAADEPARHDAQPRTAQAWQAVGDAAAQLTQSSHTLAQPGLVRDRDDWLQWATALQEGAATAAAAARRHDPRALFSAGSQVRGSCQGCHARYAVQAATPR